MFVIDASERGRVRFVVMDNDEQRRHKVMERNDEKLRQFGKDLRRQEPRDADDTLAGFVGAARCLDKCRASLLGLEGEYQYGCPMDQSFLREAGISKEEFKKFVASGASDEEVEEWLTAQAAK